MGNAFSASRHDIELKLAMKGCDAMCLLEMRLSIYGEIHNKTAEVYEIMGKVKNDSHND